MGQPPAGSRWRTRKLGWLPGRRAVPGALRLAATARETHERTHRGGRLERTMRTTADNVGAQDAQLPGVPLRGQDDGLGSGNNTASWRRQQPPVRTVGLYIAEEQQILRQAYQSFFQPFATIEVVGTTGNTDGESLVSTVVALQADVLLLGVKILQPAVVERLEALREASPELAIVMPLGFLRRQRNQGAPGVLAQDHAGVRLSPQAHGGHRGPAHSGGQCRRRGTDHSRSGGHGGANLQRRVQSDVREEALAPRVRGAELDGQGTSQQHHRRGTLPRAEGPSSAISTIFTGRWERCRTPNTRASTP